MADNIQSIRNKITSVDSFFKRMINYRLHLYNYCVFRGVLIGESVAKAMQLSCKHIDEIFKYYE